VNYDFSGLLQERDTCDAFRKNVSVFTYESFYDPYIKHQLDGFKNVAWPNKILSLCGHRQSYTNLIL
jgi:hypothetical protein